MPHPAAELLNRARQAHKQERFADAETDLLTAVEICRDSGDRGALAVALRQLGEAQRHLDNAANALKSYEEAVTLMRSDAEPQRLAHTIRHLGDVYEEPGEPDLVRPCYKEALAMYRSDEQSNPMNVANAVRAFAVHLYDAGELERSMPLWEEARATYRSFGIHAGVAGCSVRLARVARHQCDDALVQQCLVEAKAAAAESGEDDTLAYVKSMAKELAWKNRD